MKAVQPKDNWHLVLQNVLYDQDVILDRNNGNACWLLDGRNHVSACLAIKT